MTHQPLRLNPYFVAVLSVFIATALTSLFQPVLAPIISPLYFVAVAVSSYYGGFKPGMVAVILSAVSIHYFFVQALYTPTVLTWEDLIRLGTFFVVATIINLLNENLRNAKQQIQQLSDRRFQTQEAQLKQALQAAHMGMWDWNLVTGEIIWSPEHEQLFGLEFGTFDGTHETFKACVHPDDYEALNQAIQTALQTHSVYQHEYRVVWKDGSIHWVEGRGQGFYDAMNQPVRISGTIMNISDRKHAETRLRNQQELLQTIVNNIPVMLALFNENYEFEWINQEYERVLGWTLEDAKSRNLLEELYPDPGYREQVLTYIQETKQTWRDFKTRVRDGRMLDTSWANVRLSNGFSIGIGRDITEQKRAEASLRQSEEQLRQILQQMPVMLDAFDENWNIIVWNEECARVTGFSADEVIGNPTIMEQFYPDAHYRQQMIATWLKQGNNYRNWEWELTCKDGDTRTISWSTISDNFPVAGWANWGIGVDVTKRKQAEKNLQDINTELEQRVKTRTAELTAVNDRLLQSLSELQHSQQEIEDLYNRAPCGYHSLDQEGRFVRINQTELNWLGYEAHEVLGKPFTDFVTPDEVLKFQETFPTFQQQGWIHNLEFTLHCRDGSLLPISISATVINDANGNMLMTRSSVFDLRERKRVDQLKTEFLSIVSHELRTPLTSINGALELLSTGLLQPQSERGQQTIQIAAQEADRLTRLVNDILDLERLESGKVRLEMKPCNLADLMIRAVDFMQLAADQAAITLAVEPHTVSVNIDSDRILQVLTNLLSNAIKFSNPGSTVWLTAKEWESEQSHPPISPSPHPPILLFTVKDQGRGIPSDKLETIFERFHQVDASDSRKKGGTGLGLAICRNIVEQHGGKIWAESIPGQGSLFNFTLPMKE